MNLKSRIKKTLNIKTLNKKIFLLSKLIALSVIFIYLISKSSYVESKVGSGIVVGLAIILMLVLDFLLKKILLEPIKHLEERAKKMSELDFSEYCKIHTGDEFESLGNNLNLMADNLQESLRKLEKTNLTLEEEIQIKKKLLDQRKELVDQLAHEMKTPLGVIKSYAEGANDSKKEEEKGKYLQTIISASDEMTSLIESLLDLSAIESETVEFKREKYDFIELVETCLGQLLIDIPERFFEVRYNFPEEGIYVFSDKTRMKQVIGNLLINAKNNVEKMGFISVEIYKVENILKFLIFNTGERIPITVGDRLWEKFYKVDKNKKKSGNGLGLAIVSEILNLEKIEYGYRNRENGVEFYFYIPIKE